MFMTVLFALSPRQGIGVDGIRHCEMLSEKYRRDPGRTSVRMTAKIESARIARNFLLIITEAGFVVRNWCSL